MLSKQVLYLILELVHTRMVRKKEIAMNTEAVNSSVRLALPHKGALEEMVCENTG